MRALYLSHPGKRADELAFLAQAQVDLDPDRLLIFAQSGGTGGWPISTDQVGNAYCPLPPDAFTKIIVGSSMRLFASPWSKAFLRHLYKAVVPGGTLAVSFVSDAEAARKGYWSLAGLRALFGQDGECSRNGQLVIITREGKLPKVDSVLDWNLRNHGILLTTAVDLLANRSTIDEELVRDICRPMALREHRLTIEPIMLQDLPQQSQLGELLDREAYFNGGVGYKSALLRHIAKRYFEAGQPLRVIDHGGGSGFTAVEMLLQRDLQVTKAVCCDVSLLLAMVTSKMFADMRECLADRFFFELTPIQDFDYDEDYDLISFLGSLLYVPREDTEQTLGRAWDSLRPGGVLVIHENIKSRSYTRDYDLMFTVEELEGFLRPLAHIDYYLSTATIQITKEMSGTKSVFRVLQKAD